MDSNYFKTPEQIIANGIPLPKGRRKRGREMTGAIEFMKAWRDICSESKTCGRCPVTTCQASEMGQPLRESDELITELVRQVMTESRKPKAEELKRKTPKTQEEARRAYSGEEFWGEDLSGHEREDWG